MSEDYQIPINEVLHTGCYMAITYYNNNPAMHSPSQSTSDELEIYVLCACTLHICRLE